MKRIILTDRDNKIIDFLNEYGCATTSTLMYIFFNGSKRPCSRRLQHLREHNFINSSQEYVALEQVHYVGRKPTQLKHKTILSSLIANLHQQNIQILKSRVEYKIGDIRADGLLVLKIKGKNYIYFVEVCNTKKFDLNKYINLYESKVWESIFPIFPSILVVSDKEVDTNNRFDIKVFDTKLNGFKLG